MKKAEFFYSGKAPEGDINLLKLISILRRIYSSQSRKYAIIPQRQLILREKPFAAFGSMPAYSEKLGIFINKTAAMIAQSEARSINAVVSAFSSSTGSLLGLLDGAKLTKIKCTAISALVTDLCAPKSAANVGVIGSGVQAHAQLNAVLMVRDIKEVYVYSRNPKNCETLIKNMKKVAPQVRFHSCMSAQESADGRDILITATTSYLPLFEYAQLPSNVHINCVGAHTSESRELPRTLLANSQLVVEDLTTAIQEAGEIHARAFDLEAALNAGPEKMQNQTTIFSSTGHAFLDLITTAYILGLIN